MPNAAKVAMSPLHPSAIALVLMLPLAAGCRTEGDTVGKTALTRAVIDTTPCAEAVSTITARRCEKVAHCATKRHDASFQMASCMRDLRSHLELELDPSTACPEDVDHRALKLCLDAIEKDACPRTVASIDQVVACRHSELCARAFPAPLQ